MTCKGCSKLHLFHYDGSAVSELKTLRERVQLLEKQRDKAIMLARRLSANFAADVDFVKRTIH